MNTKETFPLPDWSSRLLQGLAYWVAYKNMVFPDYPLREAAIIAEATSLLYVNIYKLSINCEVMYKDLIGLERKKFSSTDEEKVFNDFKDSLGAKRIDIIVNNKEKNNLEDCLIEVKRILNDNVLEENEIEDDVDRLANYLKFTSNKNARGFVLIVSQDDIPRKFVTDSFMARKAIGKDDFFWTIKGNNKYRVRMVRKAIPSFREIVKYNQDRVSINIEDEESDNTYNKGEFP